MKCNRCDGFGAIEQHGATRPQTDVVCPVCSGSGEQPEATFADVIALLERQAETCERIAKTLGEIAETVKGL